MRCPRPYRPARPRFGLAGRVACLLGLAGLTGCIESGVAGLTDHLPAYSKRVDKPLNVIERALADCKEKTEIQEIKCVKAGLADASVSMPSLVAMIPGCRLGRVCPYDYTTDDRLGYIEANAGEFIVHWRVSFDLRRAGVSVADVPITVTQR